MTCACGRENREDARFCDACGSPLAAASSQTGERRQLSLLFCDIVGYTSLSRMLDEDDELHEVVGSDRRTVSDIVERWGGHIKDHRGDDVCAYFGYPRAHEDDAERAVRAGLEIARVLGSRREDDASAVGAPGQRQLAANLVVRIGIHTGPVTLAELGHGERDKQPLGPSLNVAARLQGEAPPGSVVISEATEQLVAGMFHTRDMGMLQLKGIDEPIRAHVVLESTGKRSRLDMSPTPSPFVGRTDYLSRLAALWEHVREGRGQAVLISGDAGFGKSRIVREFTNARTSAGDGLVFEWRCSPFHEGTPLYPVAEGLMQHLRIDHGSSREHVTNRVREFLAEDAALGGADLIEPSRLLAEMLAPGLGDAEDAPRETAPVRRLRTLNLLCELARAQARAKPAVMVADDLHWADPSTIDLVTQLLQRLADVPLMLVLTFRPDFLTKAPAAFLGPHAEPTYVHTIAVGPLSEDEGGALFDALVGARMVPPDVRDELLKNADGVPLYLEELTRRILERADSAGDTSFVIPSTLQGLLTSRLDRLSPGALETIHLASAFSREFQFELLSSVSRRDPAQLRGDLDELVRSGLVFRSRGRSSEGYAFTHALLAEAAYTSMLKPERRRLHAHIARRLLEALPSIAAEQPQLLAHHFSEAGEADTAIEYWLQAGDAAIARGAYQEALRHFDLGLKLLPQLASDPSRLRHEIELTESRGTALFSMLGYSHPDVERTFAHASLLCEQEGSSPSLRVLYGLWAVHMTRANRDQIESLLPRFEELARSGDPVVLLTTHTNAGLWAFFSGRFEESLERMTEAVGWYSTTEHSAFLRRYGYGGGIYPFAYRMWTLSMLGRPELASAAARQLEETAAQSNNPYGVAIAAAFLINFARDRRETEHTFELADRQLEYTRRQMLPFWEGHAHIARGWARAHLGDVTGGVEEVNLGFQYLDAVGLRATYPYHLTGLAEALLLAGDATGALAAAERGLDLCNTTLDRFCEGELTRLQAECRHRMGDRASAETGFEYALTVARRQSASLFAVRAAASLARLLADGGEHERARQTLDPLLADSPTAMETGETKDARRLLEMLVA